MKTFLLIPGAGGTAWYWHRLIPELRRRGHDAIAVDLPAADDSAGLTEYAAAAVHAAEAEKAGAAGGTAGGELVVVGQSMGGLTAPIVCTRLAAARLVLLNAMIPTPGETGGAWWANTGQDEARRAYDVEEGRDPEGPFDPLVYFFHDVPDNVVEEAMAAGDEPQSGTPFEQPWPLAAWPDVPTDVLVAREDRFFPAEFQARIAKERLGLTPRVLPGGHLIALSRPEELADALTDR
jgi:pimeloyl-ACP methyl ester carboxylesterase